MSFGLFNKMEGMLRNCCSGIKTYVLTRRFFDTRESRMQQVECEIACDLTDRRTFFAWQRNHMANERTFLSWCRTGIALMAFGFVIERFDILLRESRILVTNQSVTTHLQSTRIPGITALLLGALIIVLAGWRFLYIRKHINRGETEFSTLPDLFLMSSVLVTVGVAFVFFAFFL